MVPKERISCPMCGALMNRHAEKLDMSMVSERGGATDLGLGGVLEEFHTCPFCKFIVRSRPR